MESRRVFFVAQLIPRLSAIFAYPSVNPKAPPRFDPTNPPRKKIAPEINNLTVEHHSRFLEVQGEVDGGITLPGN